MPLFNDLTYTRYSRSRSCLPFVLDLPCPRPGNLSKADEILYPHHAFQPSIQLAKIDELRVQKAAMLWKVKGRRRSVRLVEGEREEDNPHGKTLQPAQLSTLMGQALSAQHSTPLVGRLSMTIPTRRAPPPARIFVSSNRRTSTSPQWNSSAGRASAMISSAMRCRPSSLRRRPGSQDGPTGPLSSLFVPEMKPQVKLLEASSLSCVEFVHEELVRICMSLEFQNSPRLHAQLVETVSKLLRERLNPTSGYTDGLI